MTSPNTPSPPTAASVQLSGWRLGLAWAVLLFVFVAQSVPVLLAVPVYTAVLFEAEPPFEAIHVGASSWRGGTVTPRPGGVAEAAGMPRGRLVAVDGQPIVDYTILKAAALVDGPVGEAVALTVETDEGETVTTSIVRTDVLPPEFAGLGMGYVPYTLLHDGLRFLTCLVFLVTAGIVAARRRRSLVALIAAGAWLWFAFRSPLSSMLDSPSSGALPLVELPPLLDLLRVVGLQLAGYGVLLFVAVFPDGRVRPRWALLPLLLFLAFHGYGVALSGVLPPIPPPAFIGLIVLAIVVGVAAQAVRYRWTSTTEQRQQTKWAMLGLAAGLGSLLLFVLVPFVLPDWGSSASRLARLGTELLWAGTMAFPIGVTVSLLRYKLWDAEAAWSRSAMAAALTLALTAIVAGGTALVQAALGASGPLALGLATATAAIFFVPLQRRLGAWADHRFLRDLTDLKERLPQLVAHLRETESIEGIAEAVTDRVLPAVHATHVALVVSEGEAWSAVGVENISASSTEAWAQASKLATPPELKGTRRHPWREVVWRQPEDRTFPVRVALRAERGGGELATEGWLLLGPRPDGSGYGPDDLEAVAEIAGPVGRALQVVRVREARDATQTERTDALANSLRQVRESLGAIREALGTTRPTAGDS